MSCVVMYGLSVQGSYLQFVYNCTTQTNAHKKVEREEGTKKKLSVTKSIRICGGRREVWADGRGEKGSYKYEDGYNGTK